MFENIKKWFERSEEDENEILKNLSDVYQDRILFCKKWEEALNEVIDSNRSEDGYTYIYLPIRDAYIRAEKANIYATPSVSGGIIKSLMIKGEIYGFSFLTNRDVLTYVLHDRRIIDVHTEIVIIEPAEFYEAFESVKTQIINSDMKSMSSEMFNAISKYPELFTN